LLQIDCVSKTFNAGHAAEIQALRDVSLSVKAGEWVVVVGPNGAGKSTLAGAITGMPVDSGSIVIAGVDVTGRSEPQRAASVARVSQDPESSTAGSLTIEENLAAAVPSRRVRSLGWALTAARRTLFVERLAELRLGLESRTTELVSSLSGGERQALACVMAELREPKVLVLDEHCAHLDPHVSDSIMSITSRLVTELGAATVMITHRLQDAIRYGDRVLVMLGGRVVADMSSPEKQALTADDLARLFREQAGDVPDEWM